jgi:hypothetical protein
MRKPFITPNRIQAPRRRHCGQSVPQPSAGSASAWRRLMRGITTATPGACYAARRRPKLEAVAHVADRLFVGHRAGKRLSRFKGLEGPAGLPRRSQRYFRHQKLASKLAIRRSHAKNRARAFATGIVTGSEQSEIQTASCSRRQACGKIRAHPLGREAGPQVPGGSARVRSFRDRGYPRSEGLSIARHLQARQEKAA